MVIILHNKPRATESFTPILALSRKHQTAKLLIFRPRQLTRRRPGFGQLYNGKLETRERALTLSSQAVDQIRFMQRQKQVDGSGILHLRMGVTSGGCSGLSYTLTICEENDISPSDHVEMYPQDSFCLVVDEKSLIYVFGLQLDYSSELIGGGFRFENPNARKSCGCGMSFGVSEEISRKAAASIPANPKRCSK